jgi:hypothetical protein
VGWRHKAMRLTSPSLTDLCVPSPPCGMATPVDTFLVGALSLTPVPSPPCGMATQGWNNLKFMPFSGGFFDVPSPPCGMATYQLCSPTPCPDTCNQFQAHRVGWRRPYTFRRPPLSIINCSKPTVWDGDLCPFTEEGFPSLGHSSKPTVWDGDRLPCHLGIIVRLVRIVPSPPCGMATF